MKRSTQLILSVVIPLIIFISFHFTYSSLEKKDKHKTCTYMNSSICVVRKENSSDIKNIDLVKYKVNTSNLKQGQDVNYETKTVKSQIITNYSIVIALCLFLSILIAFPQIIAVIFELFGAAF